MSKGLFVDRYRNNRRDCIISGLIMNVRNNSTVSLITDAIYEMNIERKSNIFLR